MRIIDLSSDDPDIIQQVATLFVKGLQAHLPSAWPDMHAALEEVQTSFGADRISRVALDGNGMVLGWISGQMPKSVWPELGTCGGIHANSTRSSVS